MMNRSLYGAFLAVAFSLVGCGGGESDASSERTSASDARVAGSNVSVERALPSSGGSGAAHAPAGGPSSVPAAPRASSPEPGLGGQSAIVVKRLVVSVGVKDREPLAAQAPLVADGRAIFAFAELANPGASSENVRITFERKGGAERAGNVTLPVPAQVSRHRTWATTRFIRAAGVWEAVLWSEAGRELGRTSFEVSAS